MSLANNLVKSKYRPHHRNAKDLAAVGILTRDGSSLWVPCHSLTSPMATGAVGALLMEHVCAPWRAAKPPHWIKISGLLYST